MNLTSRIEKLETNILRGQTDEDRKKELIELTFEKFKAIDINTRINFFKYRNDRNDPEYEKEFLFVFQEIENYLKKLYSNGEISDTDMTLLFGKKKGELK